MTSTTNSNCPCCSLHVAGTWQKGRRTAKKYAYGKKVSKVDMCRYCVFRKMHSTQQGQGYYPNPVRGRKCRCKTRLENNHQLSTADRRTPAAHRWRKYLATLYSSKASSTDEIRPAEVLVKDGLEDGLLKTPSSCLSSSITAKPLAGRPRPNCGPIRTDQRSSSPSQGKMRPDLGAEWTTKRPSTAVNATLQMVPCCCLFQNTLV